jgi:hypothetical protein
VTATRTFPPICGHPGRFKLEFQIVESTLTARSRSTD